METYQEKYKNISDKKLLSLTIEALRFPLSLLVILMHTNLIGKTIFGENFVLRGNLVIINKSHDFFYYFTVYCSDVISQIVVPLFFFISGLLFFSHIDNYDIVIYKNKIIKRTRTLLIPLIMWGILSLVIFIIRVWILHPDYHYLWSFKNTVASFFFNYDDPNLAPLDAPLWFIRDLYVVCLLSPIIYYAIKKNGIVLLIIFGAIWFFGLGSNGIKPIEMTSFFFFSYGSYFSIKKIDLLKIFNKNGVYYIFFSITIILSVIDLLTIQYKNNKGDCHLFYIHNAFIIMSCLIIIICTSNIIRRYKISYINNFLSKSGFAIYAFHWLVIFGIQNKVIEFLCKSSYLSTFKLFIIYIFTFVITAVVSWVIYLIIRRNNLLSLLFLGNRK